MLETPYLMKCMLTLTASQLNAIALLSLPLSSSFTRSDLSGNQFGRDSINAHETSTCSQTLHLGKHMFTFS